MDIPHNCGTGRGLFALDDARGAREIGSGDRKRRRGFLYSHASLRVGYLRRITDKFTMAGDEPDHDRRDLR